MAKVINDRCPLVSECLRKKCEYKFKESACPYYMANSRPGFEIEDQSLDAKIDFDEIFEEMSKSEIVHIDIDDIEPHPDNPRKNIGDISELADSIKVNGILQNLTVVPGKTKPYMALIGHKRLAAAKQAGLLEVPCIVTEMDYKTQIAIMLQENMLRTDLTAYEQAQAFGQLQFDLGASISEISNMTGMSQTTVRRRMNLLDLNADEFKASQERGATMSDYLELEKIKDINLRNDVLKKAGTKDFGWSLQSAIQKEADEFRRAEWFELLNSVAEKVELGTRSNREQLAYFHMRSAITQEDRNKIGEAVAQVVEECGGKLYWCHDPYNSAYLLGNPRTEHGPTAEEKAAEESKRKAKNAEIAAIEKNAYNLRKNFVLNYSGKKEHLTPILKELLQHIRWSNVNETSIATFLNISLFDESEDTKRSIFEDSDFNTLLSTKPQKVLLIYLFHIVDGENSGFHNWKGDYAENKNLVRFYDVIEVCGYEISTDETQLIDGTHAVFGSEKNDTETN